MARQSLVAGMRARLPRMLTDIEELVRCESPSSVLDAVAASADVVAGVGERLLGAAPERVVRGRRAHLRWRLGGAPSNTGPRVLLLAHHDTVWPLGTLATHPFSVSDGVLRGPGCFDMKAGLVLAVHGIAVRGTTVTPTVMSAGQTTNTVPASGEFTVDVRMWDEAEQKRVDEAMRDLTPVLQGAVLTVTGGPNRPPLPWSASSGLFERACLIADQLGLPPLAAAAVGGASDGNFTAGVGTPTLDGLGAVGGGAHAPGEHVLVDALPGRAALLTTLIGDLLGDQPDDEPGGRA